MQNTQISKYAILKKYAKYVDFKKKCKIQLCKTKPSKTNLTIQTYKNKSNNPNLSNHTY